MSLPGTISSSYGAKKKAKTFLLYMPFCLPFYRPFRRCITSVLLYTFLLLLLLLGPKKLKHLSFTCLTLVFGGGAVLSPVVSPVLLRVLREEHEPPGRRVLQLLLVHKLLHVEAAEKKGNRPFCGIDIIWNF